MAEILDPGVDLLERGYAMAEILDPGVDPLERGRDLDVQEIEYGPHLFYEK